MKEKGRNGGAWGRCSKGFRVPLAIVVFAIVSTALPLTSLANSNSDAFNRLNTVRQMAGIPQVSRDVLLSSAAAGHAAYLNLNNAFGHNETPGLPGFFGATLTDRIQAVGYDYGSIGEVVSGGLSGAAAVDSLMEAIYHRFLLLNPDYTEAGVGSASHPSYQSVVVIDLGRPSTTPSPTGILGIYPADGQTGVPTTFQSDTEIPDPVPGKNEVGYPVSIHASSDLLLNMQDFSLYRGGQRVRCRLLSPEGNSHVINGYAIVPLDPLIMNARYDVIFQGTMKGSPFEKRWSFSTGQGSSTAPLVAPSLQITVIGTRLTVTWSSVPGAGGYLLYYAPYPSASTVGYVDLGSATSISVTLWHGAAFYVAVQPYNSVGAGPFSSIGYFIIP